MTDIRRDIDLTEAKDKLERIRVSYSPGSLSPVISAANFDTHYNKLYKKYVDNYNQGENKTFNEAGAYLHGLYFSQFGRVRGIKPYGQILNLIERKFDNFVDFKKSFKQRALDLSGSGWVYLSKSGEIKTIQNHAKRSDIALIVDMWEHAYMNDHHSRDRYLDAIWKIIDWNSINSRL